MKLLFSYSPILIWTDIVAILSFNTKEKLNAVHSDELKTVQFNDYSAILDFRNDTKTEVW